MPCSTNLRFCLLLTFLPSTTFPERIIDTKTEICQSPKVQSHYSSTFKDCPRLVLLLCDGKSESISANFDRQINQTLTLIKSILITMEDDGCVQVVLVSNKEEHVDRIKAEIFESGNWDKKYTARLRLDFVPLRYPPGSEWIQGIYRPGGTVGLFLADLLPYDTVIYADTDVLFLRGINHLWSHLKDFNVNTLIGAARLSPRYRIRKANPQTIAINAGVMLMNLTRMREINFAEKVMSVSKAFMSHVQAGNGFEDMLNIYFYDFPNEISTLSCGWNFTPSKCLPRQFCKDDGLTSGISALHGSLCAFMEDTREPMFQAIYQAFANSVLTSTFDLKQFIMQIKIRMDTQRSNKKSACGKIDGFENLVLGWLRQKVANYFEKC